MWMRACVYAWVGTWRGPGGGWVRELNMSRENFATASIRTASLLSTNFTHPLSFLFLFLPHYPFFTPIFLFIASFLSFPTYFHLPIILVYSFSFGFYSSSSFILNHKLSFSLIAHSVTFLSLLSVSISLFLYLFSYLLFLLIFLFSFPFEFLPTCLPTLFPFSFSFYLAHLFPSLQRSASP